MEDATPVVARLSRNEGPLSLVGMVRRQLRLLHRSPRTEEAYVAWIRRFARYHGLRHPRTMGEPEVTEFLTHLAVREHVSASTQNQALAALMFLHKEVFRESLPWLSEVLRARRSARLPAVLSREDVRRVIGEMPGVSRLVALVMYGSGLRLLEALALRVKDLDLDRAVLTVRAGKGGKDRVTVLPRVAVAPLTAHLRVVRRQHDRDLRGGAGTVELPSALARKAPGPSVDGNGNGCSPRLG